MNQSLDRLIWLDLEMTGLNIDKDVIIEIATIVTDAQLNIIAEGPCLAIYYPEPLLEDMDEWNTKQHTKSGLLNDVQTSTITPEMAEIQTLDFLKQHVPAGVSPMCGNSIWQDRRFIAKYMPTLEKYFHYRHIDVSTIKELARRWKPEIVVKKEESSLHRALSDVKESIAELRHYREFWMV
jgi:oligoribonuclease